VQLLNLIFSEGGSIIEKRVQNTNYVQELDLVNILTTVFVTHLKQRSVVFGDFRWGRPRILVLPEHRI